MKLKTKIMEYVNNTKGVMGPLTGLGLGIVTFAIVIGVGLIILQQFGNNQPAVNDTLQTIIGYLGTSSGGLATWIPIVVVALVGALVLSLFFRRGGFRG